MSPAPSNPRGLADADLVGDLIQRADPLFGIVWINPARMSGTPCFYATRVPVKHLFDYLRAGDTLDAFLDDFPGVERSQAAAVLELAPDWLTHRGAAA